MVADAVNDHRADVVGQGRKAFADFENNAIIERIALGRPVQADPGDVVAQVDDFGDEAVVPHTVHPPLDAPVQLVTRRPQPDLDRRP